MSRGRVYLVGAGPGDPELLTLKGLRLIQTADVIAYDRLIDTRLLAHARADAELVDVGKVPGSRTQTAISSLLVSHAREGRRVVRLKGGDPFVFGRGGEEAEALNAANVDFEIVPGVTSAIAAPAYAGIPVTHRDHASSFTVVTGSAAPDGGPGGIDWSALAAIPGTLVFLMAWRNLDDIAFQLIDAGKPQGYPGRRSELGNTALAADGRWTARLDCGNSQVGGTPVPDGPNNRERGRAAREAELVRDAAAIRKANPRHQNQEPGQYAVQPTLGAGRLPDRDPHNRSRASVRLFRSGQRVGVGSPVRLDRLHQRQLDSRRHGQTRPNGP